MTAILSAIRADLRRITLATPGLPPGLMWKWEGRAFAPVVGQPYVRERLMPINADTATLGSAGSQQEDALYYLDVYMPSDLTVTEGTDLADSFRSQFWAGRAIGSAAPTPMWGNVINASQSQMIEGDGWNQYPVRVNFFVRRPTRM
jgi:hypothetical protein